MVRGYTTIEQSKKLVELGLDPSTADMYYFLDPTPAGNIYHLAVQRVDVGIKNLPQYNEGDIPCWSLSALLELMPYYEIAKDTDYIVIDSIGDYALKTEGDETLLDVVVNMLCELIEQKHIKVNK